MQTALLGGLPMPWGRTRSLLVRPRQVAPSCAAPFTARSGIWAPLRRRTMSERVHDERAPQPAQSGPSIARARRSGAFSLDRAWGDAPAAHGWQPRRARLRAPRGREPAPRAQAATKGTTSSRRDSPATSFSRRPTTGRRRCSGERPECRWSSSSRRSRTRASRCRRRVSTARTTPTLEAAVKEFQRRMKITETGEVDAATMAELDRVYVGREIDRQLAQAPGYAITPVPEAPLTEYAFGTAPAALNRGMRRLSAAERAAVEQALSPTPTVDPVTGLPPRLKPRLRVGRGLRDPDPAPAREGTELAVGMGFGTARQASAAGRAARLGGHRARRGPGEGGGRPCVRDLGPAPVLQAGHQPLRPLGRPGDRRSPPCRRARSTRSPSGASRRCSHRRRHQADQRATRCPTRTPAREADHRPRRGEHRQAAQGATAGDSPCVARLGRPRDEQRVSAAPTGDDAGGQPPVHVEDVSESSSTSTSTRCRTRAITTGRTGRRTSADTPCARA